MNHIKTDFPTFLSHARHTIESQYMGPQFHNQEKHPMQQVKSSTAIAFPYQ